MLLLDVAAQPGQQHEGEEALREPRVEVGHKQLGGLQGSDMGR